MQEATTFNIFYDGIFFQDLATVLIYVFTLRYGPGLLFRGPLCTVVEYVQYYAYMPTCSTINTGATSLWLQ